MTCEEILKQLKSSESDEYVKEIIKYIKKIIAIQTVINRCDKTEYYSVDNNSPETRAYKEIKKIME